VQKAADFLYEHWENRTHAEGLPLEWRPTTRAEGYAIQQVMETRTAAPLFGWKLAATSKAGQMHIGVDGPLAGRIIQERVIPDGGVYPAARSLMQVAELEFAFRFKREICPRRRLWEVPEALEEIVSLHPAIELPDSRFTQYENVGAPQLVADDACADFFVLGPACPDSWRGIDLAEHEVWGCIQGADRQRGLGRNVLGDPRIALCWFLDEASRNDIVVRAGEVVTTGTCLQPMKISRGADVFGDFGVLGTVSVKIA
jgi:2-keto-4-pentenoate hydratase